MSVLTIAAPASLVSQQTGKAERYYRPELIIARLIGDFIPYYFLDHSRGLSFLLLSANIFIAIKGQALLPIAHLWSISVEEQFYLVWPSLAKAGGAKLLRNLSIILIPASLLTVFLLALRNPDPFSIWVNSVVQFLFFAMGALLSLGLRGRTLRMTAIRRIAMLGIGAFAWMFAIHVGFLSAFPDRNSALLEAAGYGIAAVGCLCIFLACLEMPRRWLPRKLIYLGRISYGLYVFHLGILLFAYNHAPKNVNPWLEMVVMDTSVLAVTIAISMASYRYFEKPFLVLKERFEFVRSRPA